MERSIRDPKRLKLLARKRRVARTLRNSDRPRLTIHRTARHIYAQIDDPRTGRTVTAVSTRCKGLADGATGNVEAAKKVGAAIAERARERSIEEVVFNRNGFLYHGRVKALADAAREAGLKF